MFKSDKIRTMSEVINKDILKRLYRPSKESHKGQNGKLTIIGGSKLFHGASLWALKTASRIVDMVFYSTVPENEKLTQELSQKLYDFICIPRNKLAEYIEQSDAVLIGPGMVRGDKEYSGTGESGDETRKITQELLVKFPNKKWVIDAGALQVMDPEWLKPLKQVIITPHRKEFERLFNISLEDRRQNKMINPSSIHQSSIISHLSSVISLQAKEYGCVIVLKGKTDIICSPNKSLINQTGNEGMTKGGTGDVLAGLIAALACKNDLFLAAAVGTYINGLAGDELYKTVGPYYNASDLCDQIPKTMGRLINKSREK